MGGILEFADQVKLEDIEDVISRQIAYNTAIADEGLAHNYGANIGKVPPRHTGIRMCASAQKQKNRGQAPMPG